MDELTGKINMWRLALEERGANLGIMQVFDSMLVFMGEQQREIEKLEKRNEQLLVLSSSRLEKLIEIQHIIDK